MALTPRSELRKMWATDELGALQVAMNERDYWKNAYDTQHRTVHAMEDEIAELRGAVTCCPEDEVCKSCPCAAEDDVCFPDERLRAERDRLREALERIEGSPRAGIGCVHQKIARDALALAGNGSGKCSCPNCKGSGHEGAGLFESDFPCRTCHGAGEVNANSEKEA